MRHKEAICAVCSTAKGKYLFKCCRRQFCSTMCFSKHDSSACLRDGVVYDACAAAKNAGSVRVDRVLLDIDERDLLTSAVTRKIVDDPKIRNALLNSKLRKLLSRVYRSKEKRELTRQLIESNRLFKEFSELVDDVVDRPSS